MKSFLKLLIIAGVIVLLSAFLAPWLYDFLPYKFPRIFNRLIMIGSFWAIILFVRIRRSTLEKYGIWWQGKESAGNFIKGFVIGVGVLIVLAFLKSKIGSLRWTLQDIEWAAVGGKALGLFFTALLIGVLEEFFFRGFIFDAFRSRMKMGVVLAVILTSLFYSLVHFVNYVDVPLSQDPGFKDSLKLALNPVYSLKAIPFYWNEALGLFIFGLILNALVLWTGSLYSAIGLHAGCVFFIKMDGQFVEHLRNNDLLFTSDLMYDGALGWVFLLIMGFIFRFLLLRSKKAR